MSFAPSFEDIDHTSRRLANRVRSSLETCEELLRSPMPDFSAQISELLTAEVSPALDSLLLHPELVRWQRRLTSTLRGSPTRSALSKLSALLPEVVAVAVRSEERAGGTVATRGHFDAGMDSPALSEVLEEAVRRRAERRQQTGQPPDYVAVQPVGIDTVTAPILQRSLESIEHVWPAMYYEMKSFVRVIALYDGQAPAKKMVSFTDSSYHGAIFMKKRFLVEQAEKGESAGDLLHEATHNFINGALLSGLEVFEGRPEKMYATTFRVDPRPLMGVYHQMVVLARLSEFYRRAENLGIDGFPTVADYRPGVRAIPILDELGEMLDIIRGEAPLTDYGNSITSSIEYHLKNFH